MNKLLALFTVCLITSNTASTKTTGILAIQATIIPTCFISTKPIVSKDDSEGHMIDVLCNDNSRMDSNEVMLHKKIVELPNIVKISQENRELILTVTY